MNKQIDLPFCMLEIIDFPTKVIKFKDLPDHRLTIGKNNDDGHVLFYQINMKPRGIWTGKDPETAAVLAVAGIEKYINELYSANLQVYGYETLHTLLRFILNPSKSLGIDGSIQTIHGSTIGDNGQNELKLHLPRYLQFTMSGDHPAPTYGWYTGSVQFTNKPYYFTLIAKDSSRFSSGSFVKKGEGFKYLRKITDVMSKEDVVKEIQHYIYKYFPFIKDCGLLGEFVFDEVPSREKTIIELEERFKRKEIK